MFERQPLRTAVQKEILARIADGRLKPGKRINETHLAKELGISRTPLREAMLGLEASSFLGSDLGRGFVVPLLDPQEFLDIQMVLARLEPLALTEAMPLTSQTIMELNNLLGRSRLKLKAQDPDRAPALVLLIRQWSGLTTGKVANRVLSRDIMRLEGLCSRYWHASVRGGFDPAGLLAGLEEMYDLIRSGQSARAASQWNEQILRVAPEAARHLPATLPAG